MLIAAAGDDAIVCAMVYAISLMDVILMQCPCEICGTVVVMIDGTTLKCACAVKPQAQAWLLAGAPRSAQGQFVEKLR